MSRLRRAVIARAAPKTPVPPPPHDRALVQRVARFAGVPRPPTTPLGILALTSLAPGEANVSRQRACLASWRAAGLSPIAFQHPAEIAALRAHYDIDFVPVENTSEALFGRPFVPVSTLLRFARERAMPTLILNADIQLLCEPGELRRLQRISDDGLCLFTRYNHAPEDLARARREPTGIDGFLFHGRNGSLFPNAHLSLGCPCWDYWLPYTFLTAHLPLYTPEAAIAFHRRHALRWTLDAWNLGAQEFRRVTGAHKIHDLLNRFTTQAQEIPEHAPMIHAWLRRRFTDAAPKTIFELGAHNGTDTALLAQLPGAHVHAFEPDPRNTQSPRANVIVNPVAISDHDGRASFVLSARNGAAPWTYSSSLREPKNHLNRYPVTFGERIAVETITLDTYTQRNQIDLIDFLWADVQGAEGDMVRGGARTLARTRYLYTEYSDEELYEGQIPLAELLGLLPDFRVIELWPDDVLLENRRLV